MKRIRAFIDQMVYIYIFLNPQRGLFLLLSLLVLVSGFAAFFLDPNNLFPFLVLGGFGSLFGAWCFWSDFVRSPQLSWSKDVSFVRRLNEYRPSRMEEADGFLTVVDPDGPIVRSEAFDLNCMLNSGWDMKLVFSDAPRRNLRRTLRSHFETLAVVLRSKARSGAMFFNEQKIGVASPIRRSIAELTLYRTDYYSSALTGDIAESIVEAEAGGHSRVVLQGKSSYPSVNDGEIKRFVEFDQSGSSSLHLGVDVLAVTSDYYLQVWVQTKKNEHSPDMAAPTGSGSIDWADLKGVTTLKELIEAGGRRELFEESAERRGNATAWKVQGVRPIGYFRMPQRGGKPQFALLAKLGVLRAELVANPDEVRNANLHFYVPNLPALRQAVDNLIAEPERQLSRPLLGALMALRTAMDKRPEVVEEVLGYDTTPAASVS